MNLVARYLTASVIAGTLITVLILVSLDAVFSFVEETRYIGRGDYTAIIALLYVLLGVPQSAYQALPMATLIGSLFGLGGLAARNELTVMRAAGISVFGIARSVLFAGFALAALAFAIGEWVAPPAEKWGQDLRSMAISSQVASNRLEGFWARDGDRFIEVRRALNSEQLAGVRIYQMSADQGLAELITAEFAQYEGGVWRLRGVVRSRFAESGVVVTQAEHETWTSDLAPGVLEVVVVEPETLSALQLLTYVDYLERNQLDSDRYRLAFWVKIATPLATVVMLLLTIPLVFGSARSANAGQRLFVGVLIGIVFFLSNRLLNQMGLVYGIPPVLSAFLPTLAFLAVGLWGIARTR